MTTRSSTPTVKLTSYLAATGLLSILLLFALANLANSQVSVWLLVVLGIVALPAASDVAISFVNPILCRLSGRRTLARLDFEHGIPYEYRTLVVIPTILSRPEQVAEMVGRLERHYLANRESNLLFCLLSDFADADSPHVAEDKHILRSAQTHIARLNRQHGDHGNVFFLLHRPRLWNERQGSWLGRERKRGKLEDLNHFLLTGDLGPFCDSEGIIEELRNIAFVITLDSDTGLPPSCARRLVGTIAHPANRARVGTDGSTTGYAVVQPTMVSVTGDQSASWFERLHCNAPPASIPLPAPPNFYQDVFGEGSYYGKGIYDVAAFDSALHGRLPENWILSHDLVEGCYASAAAATDLALTENVPRGYLAESARMHRWTRGDWQLLPWLLPFAWFRLPLRRATAHLSPLSRWKIFDNLRRSLVPPSTLVLLLIGWNASTAPMAVTGAILSVFFIPVAFEFTLAIIFGRIVPVSRAGHLGSSLGEAARAFCRASLAFALLPHRALLSADAVSRSLWRMFVSRRRLLEWIPTSDADRVTRPSLLSYVRRLWIGPAIAVGAGDAMLSQATIADGAVVATLAIWFLGPGCAYLVDQPKRYPKAPHVFASAPNEVSTNAVNNRDDLEA